MTMRQRNRSSEIPVEEALTLFPQLEEFRCESPVPSMFDGITRAQLIEHRGPVVAVALNGDGIVASGETRIEALKKAPNYDGLAPMIVSRAMVLANLPEELTAGIA